MNVKLKGGCVNNTEKERRTDHIIMLIAENYGKEITKNLLQLFQNVLEPYSIQEIEQAFYIWSTSTDEKARYFPKTNDIIAIIRENQERARQKAKIRQGLIPMQSLSEEQIEANLRMMREWRRKKLEGMLQTIDAQMPAKNTVERLKEQFEKFLAGEGLD